MYCKNFSELSNRDAAIAGGKGASLGEMTNAGIPVPPGFVVLADAFEKFLDVTNLNTEIDAILHTVKTDEMRSVEHASERVQKLILESKMPEDIGEEIVADFELLDAEHVAVRSSATAEDSNSAAWAGQLDTYLNTTHETLLTNVQRCWASLFTSRAIFYRFEKDLHTTKISVAVVVQKMIQSEVSGIAFSVHPVTEDRNQLIIEAGFGLGEAIVSGQITPDSYVVEKSPRRIIDKNIVEQERGIYRKEKGEVGEMGALARITSVSDVGGNEWRSIPVGKRSEQKLSDEQILELSELIIHIEQHYGFPCDIEWAFEACPNAEGGRDGKFYIVQSRPITTLTLGGGDASAEENAVLSKMFSREKPLFYISLWTDSERLGWKTFLQYDMEKSLFLILPPGQKSSVWHSLPEQAHISEILKKKFSDDVGLPVDLMETLREHWEFLLPYLKAEKSLADIGAFELYYAHLVAWWSAMNTLWSVPDMLEVGESIRTDALQFRTESERYTESMSHIMVEFFERIFPEYLDCSWFVMPDEMRKFADHPSDAFVISVRARKGGCILFEGVVYPIAQLDRILADHHIVLERSESSDAKEIRGRVAYAGRVTGIVKKITSFADMGDFKVGMILVTEMTNPEYVPIMKIAGAVVTDEGGLTCHAAIASREMRIPCIIGTKIATQVLKDGDFVEADAHEGVVRILERAKKEKQIFEKSYTRDTSLSIQGAWGISCANLLGTPEWENPHVPVVIDYLHKGAVEIWENVAGIKWLQEKLLEKNTNDPEFFREEMRVYEKQLKFLKPYWNRESVSSIEELRKISEVIVSGTRGFVVMYLTACDDRTPKGIKVKADELRKKDKYFEENDKFMRKSFLAIHPDLEGFETAILQNEITDIPDISALGARLEHSLISGEEFLGLESLESYARRNPEMEFRFDEVPDDVNHVHGTVAYHGCVKGIARIIRKKRDIHTVKEGEILVSPMTTPDYLPAMKKSAAFVTDEGGIMCHAAIVARELKKPCIIGTKIATQVLKDGDLVEVDANEGVVRIIERG